MKNDLVLSMIVKNEAHIIEQCLNSVKPFITHWCIADTGSTDGTQDIIRKCMKDFPGEVVQHDWQNFGHNRTIGLEAGRALYRTYQTTSFTSTGEPYFLVMDADDTLIPDENFKMPYLTQDIYHLMIDFNGYRYRRPQVFKLNKPFFYKDVLHEYLECSESFNRGLLEGLTYKIVGGGGRSANPDKYKRDAELLQRELNKDPKNCRYAYYLAQSLRDAGLAKNALQAYDRRAAMPGWDEETWAAMYEAAKITERLGEKEQKIISRYLKCFEFRPRRAEPLYEIARYYRSIDKLKLGFVYASAAMEIPIPDDHLILDKSVYNWRILDEYAIAAYWSGFKEKSLAANKKLLDSGFLPLDQLDRIKKNYEFSLP